MLGIRLLGHRLQGVDAGSGLRVGVRVLEISLRLKDTYEQEESTLFEAKSEILSPNKHCVSIKDI